jgi:hypothetical protein
MEARKNIGRGRDGEQEEIKEERGLELGRIKEAGPIEARGI